MRLRLIVKRERKADVLIFHLLTAFPVVVTRADEDD